MSPKLVDIKVHIFTGYCIGEMWEMYWKTQSYQIFLSDDRLWRVLTFAFDSDWNDNVLILSSALWSDVTLIECNSQKLHSINTERFSYVLQFFWIHNISNLHFFYVITTHISPRYKYSAISLSGTHQNTYIRMRRWEICGFSN